ncbi:hypothetical protein GQ602_007211 [Ophiocordyceps camponoti-floridani]|uniref:Uncharacterized protein n=1 Tax=Ophiocordyceps camponoti-floridani TaxID=2030778 RepID=A0A8H4VAT1_9HYPO|nr:hypothetical protein GQ602_007211 [Ophiocordyceps camponoti-floridani]
MSSRRPWLDTDNRDHHSVLATLLYCYGELLRQAATTSCYDKLLRQAATATQQSSSSLRASHKPETVRRPPINATLRNHGKCSSNWARIGPGRLSIIGASETAAT